ncbi:cytoskeletal-regulatory complex EF hand-domain-containing protein [Phycomyces blakesleeanus]
MNPITPAERAKYAEIFQARGQMNGYMPGATARDVLLNSNLPPHRLERIWDLADIDKDGNLDFEEFCVAMHLTFSCINGIEPPMSLPPHLVPPNKSHFFAIQPQQTAVYAQPTGYAYQSPNTYAPYNSYSPQHNIPQPPLPQSAPEFSWDMTSQELESYQRTYSKYAHNSEKAKFVQFEDFYSSLGLSRTDLTNAWALVNVNRTTAITKDQCLTFFHILSQRQQGTIIPKTLPPDLQEAFGSEYEGSLRDRVSTGKYWDDRGPKSANKREEEDRLKRELEDLKRRVRDAEERASEPSKEDTSAFGSRPLKDQFEALYEYKLRQLTDQNDVEAKVRQQERDIEAARDAVRRLTRVVDDVRSQKREMETLLEDTRAQVQNTYKQMH